MKKFPALIVIAFFLSACKKEHVCHCKQAGSPSGFYTLNETKFKAKRQCEAYNKEIHERADGSCWLDY